MSHDDTSHASASARRGWSSIFALPAPLRDLFNRFPLVTYCPEPLPASSSATSSSTEHTLYLFTSPAAASRDLPSLHPTSLKHQTYLNLLRVPFRAFASSNHASPSGALPFVLPAGSDEPVTASQLRRWADREAGLPEAPPGGSIDVHAALLDHRLRRAWLAQLHLDPANAPAMARHYVDSTSRSSAVRFVLATQLRRAAAAELRKSSPGEAAVEARVVMAEGVEALAALEELLAARGGEWFEYDDPGWFDAAVYAYTGPLLDARMGWARNELGDALARLDGLVDHRRRVAMACGWESAGKGIHRDIDGQSAHEVD